MINKYAWEELDGLLISECLERHQDRKLITVLILSWDYNVLVFEIEELKFFKSNWFEVQNLEVCGP